MCDASNGFWSQQPEKQIPAGTLFKLHHDNKSQECCFMGENGKEWHICNSSSKPHKIGIQIKEKKRCEQVSDVDWKTPLTVSVVVITFIGIFVAYIFFRRWKKRIDSVDRRINEVIKNYNTLHLLIDENIANYTTPYTDNEGGVHVQHISGDSDSNVYTTIADGDVVDPLNIPTPYEYANATAHSKPDDVTDCKHPGGSLLDKTYLLTSEPGNRRREPSLQEPDYYDHLAQMPKVTPSEATSQYQSATLEIATVDASNDLASAEGGGPSPEDSEKGATDSMTSPGKIPGMSGYVESSDIVQTDMCLS